MARLLLRRPQSLRVMVVAMAVLAEVDLAMAVLAEVVLLDESVHVAIVPCLSYSYFYDFSCLALLLCS